MKATLFSFLPSHSALPFFGQTKRIPLYENNSCLSAAPLALALPAAHRGAHGSGTGLESVHGTAQVGANGTCQMART
jgi:hypothetical protein